MLLGINLGDEEPLGQEVLATAHDMTVDVDRYNLPRGTDQDFLRTCVNSWAGTGIRPQLMFHRVGMAPMADTVTAMAIEAYGVGGFDLEGPNEWRMQEGATLAQAIADTVEIDRAARARGWTGTMLSASVMNLQDRDLPDIEALATQLPAYVVLSIHRYCKDVWYAGQDQRRPWRGGNRDGECLDLLRRCRLHRVAVTEFGPHRVPERILLGSRTVTMSYEDCYAYLRADLELYAKHGFERACVFQFHDGPDPTNHEHRRGVCDERNVPLPHAAALVDWRLTA